MINKMKIVSNSAEETTSLARKIGAQLKGGECIELVSDVGGGKTTFVKGLVSGAGSTNHVSSPTFTISKIYKTQNFDIVHFDFYRLHEAGLIEHEIEEVVQDTNSVVVVEWSDIVRHVLPEQRLRIEIINDSQDKRVLILSSDKSLGYLTEKL